MLFFFPSGIVLCAEKSTNFILVREFLNGSLEIAHLMAGTCMCEYVVCTLCTVTLSEHFNFCALCYRALYRCYCMASTSKKEIVETRRTIK